MTGGQFQYKQPLETCPEDYLRHYCGDCRTCYRPMAPNRLMKRTPELKKWFMHANNQEQCRSCYSHRQDTESPRDRSTPRMGPDLISWLRRVTGACVHCGWLPDVPDEDGTMDRHGDRDCPEGRKILAAERDSPSDEEGLRETA